MRRKAEELEALAAAYLYGQQQTQEAIGRSLGLSQSVVSRLLSRASRDGYLETTTRFMEERVGEEEMKRVRARVRPARLQEMLSNLSQKASKQAGPTVHVYPSTSRNTSEAAWRHRLDEFGAACARDLLGVLGTASVIGVSWGDTVASAIAAMKKIAPGVRGAQTHPRTIVPLVGEPLGLNIKRSSSELAARLDEALNADSDAGERRTLSLRPVPALIPANMNEAETRAIRKLIGHITAYREIFGRDGQDSNLAHESAPLIDRVDAVLTSTSTRERPLGFEDDSVIRAAGVDREKLNDLVVGDFCGALIPRPRLDAQALGEVDSIVRRWTGVTIKQLRECVVRAQRTEAPGILVVAIGASKAPVVHAAVRSGLVQHLFTDQELADRLEQICAGARAAS